MANYWDFTFDDHKSCDEWTTQWHCYDEISFSNGSKYKGEIFKLDDRVIGAYGQGVITYSDGSILKATWEITEMCDSEDSCKVHSLYMNDLPADHALINGTVFKSEMKWPIQLTQPNGLIQGRQYKFTKVAVLKGASYWDKNVLKESSLPPSKPSLNGKYDSVSELPEKSFTGGGYDPKNEQESNKPDVNEKKDPPKTYKAQEEDNPNSADKNYASRDGLDNNKLLPAASGSGFAISKDGYVLTNHHVINGCQALNIHTNGKLISARLIASDPINDLALIKGNFKPQTVFYINPSTPKLTDDIYVAGYPFGYAISSEIKITRGAVNSLSGLGNNFSQMQIDAAIQPGNSGGPVLDKKGNVFGIAVAKLNMQAVFEDYGVIPENTNFAIKSTVAKSFAESNNIHLISKSSYKNTDLREYISNGTYYLSCMMTLARIKEMQTQKVFFQNIIK